LSILLSKVNDKDAVAKHISSIRGIALILLCVVLSADNTPLVALFV